MSRKREKGIGEAKKRERGRFGGEGTRKRGSLEFDKKMYTVHHEQIP